MIVSNDCYRVLIDCHMSELCIYFQFETSELKHVMQFSLDAVLIYMYHSALLLIETIL